MFKVSWQSLVMTALAGTTVSMVTYNIGLMQGDRDRRVATTAAKVAVADAAPAYSQVQTASVPVATDAFADGPTPTAPELTRPVPFAVAPRAAALADVPATAAADKAATPTTQPASDRPAEFQVPLAIKATGKTRPSTVGRAPEPPKGMALGETPVYLPRYGEGRVYMPANHGPVDYGYGAEYGGPGNGYGYGYGYGYPGYYRPAVREQAPLLPFERGNYRTDVGYTTPKARFVPQ